jgi:hypothetical protein
VDWLSSFVLFVGKLFGTALVSIAALGVTHLLGREVASFSITLIAIVAFLIFNIFANIIEVGVDTGMSVCARRRQTNLIFLSFSPYMCSIRLLPGGSCFRWRTVSQSGIASFVTTTETNSQRIDDCRLQWCSNVLSCHSWLFSFT